MFDSDDYGLELFHSFVPPSARARIGESARVPLVSGALFGSHKTALGGNVVEVTWAGAPLLIGALRAVRHQDALLAISVPASLRVQSPRASRTVVDAILRATDQACFDRPLVLVARAMPAGGTKDRLEESLFRDLEAGFTSLAFSARALGDDVEALGALARPVLEAELGLELELEGQSEAALALARLDEAGLPLSAVRGASSDDELGAALLVVNDTADLPGPESVVRVVVDHAISRAMRRADPHLTSETALMVVDSDVALRLEAFAYIEVAAAIAAARAQGTSPRLLDALAATFDESP